MSKDKIYISVRKDAPTITPDGRKSLKICMETHQKVKKLADKTHQPLHKIATSLIDFALEHVEITETK